MPKPVRRWVGLVVFLVLAVGLFVEVPRDARADIIILKDGFVIQGRIKRGSKVFIDPASKTPVEMQDGFYFIDDQYRQIFFSPGQVTKLEEKEPQEEDKVLSQRFLLQPTNRPIPIVREQFWTKPWNEKWDRVWEFRRVTADGDTRQKEVNQHLAILTPSFARMDTIDLFNWSVYYSTRELGPARVAELLALHPDFKEKKDAKEEVRAAKRFRAYQFFVQAGWYQEAEARLDLIDKDLPGQKEKVATARGKLKKLRSLQMLDELRLARAVGQHDAARRLIAQFPQNGDEHALGEARVLKANYEMAESNLKLAKKYLEELPKAKTDPALPPTLVAAAGQIAKEMCLDRFLASKEEGATGRLDVFLKLAVQAEKEKVMNRTPQYDPAKLLALAVSGWLLGNNSADAKPDVAVKLWKARAFVMEYMKRDDEGDRTSLLNSYMKNGPIGIDEIAQMIALMPPVESEPQLSPKPQIGRKARYPGGRGGANTYDLLLPPEYHPGRAYPVLIALHDDEDQLGNADRGRPGITMERWKELAAQHGYILATPNWQKNTNRLYSFTSEEHQVVEDVIRDLRRHFQIDSDRVFLAGVGQGGNMAYDVALSHPDLFAGVIPVGGAPFVYAARNWRNAQYLPFYVVNGSKSGNFRKENWSQFKNWLGRNFPMVYVEYRGRGAEWFGGELPNIFDWMDRKRRAHPLVQLGRDGLGGSLGEEFYTMRSKDNRFYWLSTDTIYKGNLSDDKFKTSVMSATMTASIRDNQITARVYGLKDLTIWLERGVVDFEKPISVIVNLNLKMGAKKRTPSLDVLLKDFYERCDRQRLYVDQIVIKNL